MKKMSAAQEFVFYRTYSRWLDDKKRRETYEEVFGPEGRYFAFMKKQFGDKVSPKIWQLCQDQMLSMGVMPSMRAAWSAGPALESNHILGYNCCSLAFRDLQAPVELFYILMCGSGVGFSVEREFIDLIPSVKPFTSFSVGTHSVEDSREGWANALKLGLETWFDGNDVEFDVSKVRPKGARLKTMGGRASGPDPLVKLLSFAREVILKAQGRKLKSIEWLDIGNMIGEVVVVGGVRRASEISFSDLDDNDMRHAKDWPFPMHRAMSNNSVCYKGRPDMVTFMKEWSSLAASGSGERGIFNLEAANNASPRRKKSNGYRTNPCFCPGTLIHTKQGHFPIETLVGKTVDVWDSNQWVSVDNFRVTAENQPTLRIEMQDGSEMVATPYHGFLLEDGTRIEAKELQSGMKLKISTAPVSHGDIAEPGAYLKGFMIGDGSASEIGNPILAVYDTKICCKGRLLESAQELTVGKIRTNAVEELGFGERSELQGRQFMRGISVREGLRPWGKAFKKKFPEAIFAWDKRSKLEFIAGYMDSDGTASDTKNGWLYQITSVERESLSQFQNLLKTIGVPSKLALSKKSTTKDFNDGYGEYKTKDLWRLTISQQGSILLAKQVRFSRLVSFADKKTDYVLKTRANKIVSVSLAKIEPKVYCCTVDTTHEIALTCGYSTSQCGEILLNTENGGQFCNLTSVTVRATDKFDDLVDKVKAATWLGAMQSCLTDFPYIRPGFKQICDEERLLGVSLNGQMDNPKLMSAEKLEILRDLAIKEARKAAKALGINVPVAITTGKPEGTASQLLNTASGAHPRYAQYYIRRYRISATDPLFNMMKYQGFYFSPENGQRKTDVDLKRQALLDQGISGEEALVRVPEWNESQVMTWVVEFPEAAPKNAITRDKMTAIDQLEWYLKVKRAWCEHNQSITVYVREDEWLKVGSWVFDHFNEIYGISFLPYDSGSYEQAPYEEISKEKYEELVKNQAKIDYSLLAHYEDDDNTSGAKTLACSGDSCELK